MSNKTKKSNCCKCDKEIIVDKRSSKNLCENCKTYNIINPHENIFDKICDYCGNVLTGKGKNFCNNTCSHNYKYAIYINKWLQNLENGIKGKYEISAHIRRYLFEKHYNRCQICGWNKINKMTNRIPLSIHHIDGNCLNNVFENLQLLCPNCHSLTETYGSLNKGNGRVGRIY